MEVASMSEAISEVTIGGRADFSAECSRLKPLLTRAALLRSTLP
jgi:hypothetical protein